MSETVLNFSSDASEVVQGLDRILGKLRSLEGEVGDLKKKNDELFVSGTEGARNEAAAIDRLQKEYADLTRVVNTLKSAQKNALDPRAVNNYSVEIAKAEAGLRKYERAAKDVGVTLKRTGQAGSAAANTIRAAFASITILAVIQEVINLTRQAVTLAGQINKAQKTFAAFTGSAEEGAKVLQRLKSFANENFLPVESVNEAGKALLAFGEEADRLPIVLKRIADLAVATGKNFNELALIYGKARTSGVLYAEDINQLTESGIPIVEQFAKQMGVATGEVKKLASEGKIGFDQLELAFAELTASGTKFADATKTQADELDVSWAKTVNRLEGYGVAIGNFFRPAIAAFLDALNYLDDIQSKLLETSLKIATFGLYEGKVQKAQIKEDATSSDFLDLAFGDQEATEQAAIDRVRQLQTRINNALGTFRKETEKSTKKSGSTKTAEQLAEEAFRASVEAQRFNLSLLEEGLSKELALAQLNRQVALREGVKYNADRAQIEEAYYREIAEIGERYGQLAEDKLTKDRDKKLAIERERLDIFKQIQDAEIDLLEEQYAAAVIALEKQGADEGRVKEAQVGADVRVAQRRLDVEIEYRQALLELIKKSGSENAEAEAEAAEKGIQALIQRRKNLEGQSRGTGESGDEKSFLSALGLNFDDDEVRAIQDAAQATISSIEQITAAKVEAAAREVRAADERVRAAEDALRKEEELAEEGFANDTVRARARLEEARRIQQAAIDDQKKAQRAQLAIETTTQAANLITAGSAIFKKLAQVSGPFGIPLAVVSIAAMIAAFAKAKADAFKAVKFGEGGQADIDRHGIVSGPSHARGGVPIEVEGGEFMTSDGKRLAVVNKRMTRKHFNILDAVNRDDRAGIAAAAAELAGQKVVYFTGGRSASDRSVVNRPAAAMTGHISNKKVEKLLNENNSLLRQIARKRDGVTVAGNRIITREGSVTNITRHGK